MRLNSLPIVFLALAAFAGPVCAQNIRDLGNIPDPDTSGPYATDISGDGSVIVGNAVFQFMSDFRPFRWTEADGMVALGLMAGSRSCEANSISTDGSTIAGNCIQAGVGGQRKAFSWTAASGYQQLPGLAAISEEAASAMSENGSFVVGSSLFFNVSALTRHAVRWENGVVLDLGTLNPTDPSAESSATGISTDGAIVVGWSNHITGDRNTRAFRWENGVMSDLGTVLGFASSSASATSADGNVVVGTLGRQFEYELSGAFRWVKGANGAPDLMSNLGYLTGADTASALDVSADGSTVVGFSGLDGVNTFAFRWTEADGMVNLGTLTGGTSSIANAISADGALIVGWSDAADFMRHAVVWTAGAAVDITNTSTAIAQTSANTQAFFDQRSAALSADMSKDCDSFGANNLCVSLAGRTTAVQDGFTDQAGVLTVGYRVSDTLRIGAFIDEGSISRSSDSFGVAGSRPTLGAFAAYSEASDGKGLQSRLSAAWHSDTVDITRAVLTDTEAGRGQAAVDSSMVAVEVGYGMAINPTWRATPFLGWRYGRVTRHAYSEAGNDDVSLPISYDTFSQKRSSAVVGTRLDAAIRDNLSLMFEVGGEFDLSSSQTSFAGTSGIPGLASFGLNGDVDEMRFFGSASARYDLDENEGVIATVLFGGQVNGNAGYTVMANYQVGF